MRRGLAVVILLAATCGGPDHSHDLVTLTVQAQGGSLAIAALGGTLQLVATAKDAAGRAVTVSPTWTAADSSVVSVSASGLVTAIKNGATAVSATVGSLSASVQVTVAQAPNTVAVTPQSAQIERGATAQFAAAAVDSNGQRIAGTTATWSVADAAVASIAADGTATGLAVGSTRVTAAVGGKSGTAALTVQVPAPNAVTISGAGGALVSLGQTRQLSAAATDARSNPIPEASFFWKSSDATVVSVDASGLATAKKNGTATITATSGQAQGTLDVTVAQAVSSVQVTPATDAVPPGATVDYSAAAFDANQHPVAGAPAAAWSSSDTGVVIDPGSGHATVSSGFSGAPTAVTITATVSGVKGTATLTVDPNLAPVSSITVSNGNVTLVSLGDTQDLSAQAFDANGGPLSRTFSWSSSDSTIASVDSQSGKVLAVANGGPVTITASAGGQKGTAQITVAQAVASVTLVGRTADVQPRLKKLSRLLVHHVESWSQRLVTPREAI